MDLGERLQELRKANNLTQAKLAKEINISLPQLVRYETKGVQPTAETLKKMAEVFNVSIDFIVNGDLDNKANNSIKDQELLNQFLKVEKLSDEKKSLIKEFLGAFLFKTNVQNQLI